MRRAKFEGRQIGRTPLQVDRAGLLRDRAAGKSLSELATIYGISKASVCRVIMDAQQPVSKRFIPVASASAETKELRPPIPAA
jgi:hypothetical protein